MDSGHWQHRAAATRAESTNAVAATTDVPSAAKTDRATPDDIEWLVEAVSPELASLEPAARDQLAERLLAKAARYEMADELDYWNSGHDSRVQLANRLADRIKEN